MGDIENMIHLNHSPSLALALALALPQLLTASFICTLSPGEKTQGDLE